MIKQHLFLLLNKVKFLSQIIHHFSLIFAGFVIFSSYIYLSFLRQRMPKEIPFLLTEYRLYLLIFIIFMYLYAFYRLYFPKQLNETLKYFFTFIHKPFISFDTYIKYNKYVFDHYVNFFYFIALKVSNLTFSERLFNIYKYTLFPRLILLFIFLTDVFYVNKIEIFYYFIFLGVFPLGFAYFKYSLNFAYTFFINYLETLFESIEIHEIGNSNFEDEDNVISNEGFEYYDNMHNSHAIYHNKKVSIRESIAIQYERFLNYRDDGDIYDNYGEFIEHKKVITKNNYKYMYSPYGYDHYYDAYMKKNNKSYDTLTSLDWDILHKPFFIFMEYLVPLYGYYEESKKDENYFYIPQVKGFIYLSYIICWSYILIKSYQTLPFPFAQTLFFLFSSLPFLEESFSGESIIFF